MKDPKKLREAAERLLKEAEKIEAEKYIKLGRLAAEFLSDGDLEKFKARASKV